MEFLTAVGGLFLIAFGFWKLDYTHPRSIWNLLSLLVLVNVPAIFLAPMAPSLGVWEVTILAWAFGALLGSELLLFSGLRERDDKNGFKKIFGFEPPKKRIADDVLSPVIVSNKLDQLAFQCRVAEQEVHRWDRRKGTPSEEDSVGYFQALLEAREETRGQLDRAVELAKKFGFDVDELKLAGESIPHPEVAIY